MLAILIVAIGIAVILMPKGNYRVETYKPDLTNLNPNNYDMVEMQPVVKPPYYETFLADMNLTKTAQSFNMTEKQFFFSLFSSGTGFVMRDWCSDTLPEWYGEGMPLGISQYRKCDLFGDRYIISFYPQETMVDYDSFVKTNCEIFTTETYLCGGLSMYKIILDKDK